MRFAPVFTFAAINLVAPWGVSSLLIPLAQGQQRQVVFWLTVVLLFTANQLAARYWPSWRVAFWSLSTLNILALPLGRFALATAAPDLPGLVYWLFLHPT